MFIVSSEQKTTIDVITKEINQLNFAVKEKSVKLEEETGHVENEENLNQQKRSGIKSLLCG